MKPTPKLKIIKRAVKHVFTTPEIAQLNTDFRQSFATLKSVEAEFDSVKASYKAKTTEAESRMETLNATLQAGFEIRDKNCAVIMDMKAGKKYFFLEEQIPEEWEKHYATVESWPKEKAVFTEPITEADRQQELIEAESKFEKCESIQLFKATPKDSGTLTVGRLDGKWFSSLNFTIGGKSVAERLDSEQSCSKKRIDQIGRAIKTFQGWLEENLGREEAKGFKNHLELIKAEHSEREE